jgi:RimJ/RimL family protein N-acetyltransferase
VVSSSELRTDRLLLRDWREADLAPFAEMNTDPAVMEFFPSLLDDRESDELARWFSAELAEYGYCPWAVELVDSGAFIGFVGLNNVADYQPFAPNVEVGWRLARRYWGSGYATEGASAALRYGLDQLGLAEIVSFTSVINIRSRAVMERLGMSRNPADDFEHPRIAAGHVLRPHVLYRARSTA